MVFLLFLLTVVIFLVVDLILRKEDREIEESEKTKRSPIFLSPGKALKYLGNEVNRLYHLSHSWALLSEGDYAYVGYDNFIPTLFSSDVKIHDIPNIGTRLLQGSHIWKVKLDGREISQLAPISGEIVDINPACKMDIPLPADQVERSWILKMKVMSFKNENSNLMNHNQASRLNVMLRDELYQEAQKGDFVNDGGKIDPSYVINMNDQEWREILHKFFPHMKDQN